MVMAHAAGADAAERHVVLADMQQRVVDRHAARHDARNVEIARPLSFVNGYMASGRSCALT